MTCEGVLFTESVSECEPTRGGTSNDTLSLRCDPGDNAEMFDHLLPKTIFAIQTRQLPSAFCAQSGQL